MTEESTPLHDEAPAPKRKRRARGFTASLDTAKEGIDGAPEPDLETQSWEEPASTAQDQALASDDSTTHFGFVVPVRAVTGGKDATAKRGVKKAKHLSR